MTDENLARKHAIERFVNARTEARRAEEEYNRAVAKNQGARAAEEVAAKSLVEICNDGTGRTRYIRSGDKLLVVSEHGVEISALENE